MTGIGNLLLVERARAFAIAAHEAVGQKRNYTGETYWVHPEAVARLVEYSRDNRPEVIAAAWLHDVVEDTKVSRETLAREFGDDVAALIGWVTKDPAGSGHISRPGRLRLDCQRMLKAPREAKTIKLADIYDNCRSLKERDPERAKLYLREKQVLTNSLVDGDPELMRACSDVFHRGLVA
jgi:(p)ppGpp synthase/HD superfamily hydrolase